MAHDVTNFETEVIQRSFQIPVVVDFWATWCAPCRRLTPILEKLAAQSDGAWELAKVNTEELPEPAVKYGVQGIPNVKLFSQGKVTGEFVGALPERTVAQWLKKNVPGKHQGDIAEARRLLDAGQSDNAGQLLENLLRQEPANPEIKVLMAKALVFAQPDRARELVESVDEPALSETTDLVQTFLHLFEVVNHPDALPDTPTRQAYLAASNKVRSQQFDAALEQFISIIRSDRYYDEDGARKACIAIFKYLGEEHPVTLKHRREFGSALY